MQEPWSAPSGWRWGHTYMWGNTWVVGQGEFPDPAHPTDYKAHCPLHIWHNTCDSDESWFVEPAAFPPVKFAIEASPIHRQRGSTCMPWGLDEYSRSCLPTISPPTFQTRSFIGHALRFSPRAHWRPRWYHRYPQTPHQPPYPSLSPKPLPPISLIKILGARDLYQRSVCNRQLMYEYRQVGH